jgi:hypothetical protein
MIGGGAAMRHFIFAFALLLLSAPAVADQASECRRQCGEDAACYRRCMGYRSGWHRHHYSAPKASPSEPSSDSAGGGARPAARPSIVDTAYDYLYAPGAETAGYGLYSYVILTRPNDRAVAFLRELVGRFPATSDVAEPKQQINVLYIPTKASAKGQTAFPADVEPAVVKSFVDKNYDFAMARSLLRHLCSNPAPAVAELCPNDFSGGPYLLTYGAKVSDLSPVPPPFLFVDLTNVRPRAFPLFVAAYAAQVKRPEFSDGERIADLNLLVANILLTAADWVQPVNAAITNIIHFAEAKKSGGEAPK